MSLTKKQVANVKKANDNNYNDNEIKLSILYTTDNKRHVYNNHIEENKINKEKNYEKVFKKIHDILENYKAKDKKCNSRNIEWKTDYYSR